MLIKAGQEPENVKIPMRVRGSPDYTLIKEYLRD
jgi:hypothetical protein